MSLQRTSRLTNLIRPAVTSSSSTFSTTRYASSQNQTEKTVADGESGKDTQTAQPKILSRSPPKEGEASEDVQKHNDEMSKRAERPAEKVKDEDLEKDKVGKRFWSGKCHSPSCFGMSRCSC